MDRQRLFLLQVESKPMPCPACKEKVNIFDAAGIDIDTHDFGKTRYEYRCPHCSAELEEVVPFIAIGNHWHWELKDSWLQNQLHKAKMFDELCVSQGADCE